MMKILLVSILFAVFFSYDSVQSSEVQRYWTGNSTFCHKEGYACKNCTHLILCAQNGTNFTEIPIATCGGENTCFNGSCTTKPNPECNTDEQPDFICQTAGMYPDLFDCKKYYHCIKDASWSNHTRFTVTCSCGYSYNMTTTFCDIPLNSNNTCNETYPKARCTSVGQTNFLVENPSLYYICRNHPRHYDRLYPFLYACDNGKKYNPITYLCN